MEKAPLLYFLVLGVLFAYDNLLSPGQLEIAAIVRARCGPEETSATCILKKAEACRLRRCREAQATIQSPTNQEFTLTATREYPIVVRAIKRVLDAAPSSAGPLHQPLCQGLSISSAAWQAVTQSAIQFWLHPNNILC